MWIALLSHSSRLYRSGYCTGQYFVQMPQPVTFEGVEQRPRLLDVEEAWLVSRDARGVDERGDVARQHAAAHGPRHAPG